MEVFIILEHLMQWKQIELLEAQMEYELVTPYITARASLFPDLSQ